MPHSVFKSDVHLTLTNEKQRVTEGAAMAHAMQ